MSFSSIPTRANGERIEYTWFNLLRTAGIALENFLGAGFISETSFTVANGQVAAANVTGLLISAASYKSALVFAEIRRKTASNEVVSSGLIKLHYKDLTSTWEILDELGGDEDGVTLSITAGGQVQYTSDTLAGSAYVGTMKFRMISCSA